MVSKSKLKAQMLEYFREVERTGEPLIVTDHGRAALEVRLAPKRFPVEMAKCQNHSIDDTARVSENLLAEPSMGADAANAAPTHRTRRSNLDKYAGDSDFGPEWEKFLEKDLKQIDETLWS